MIGRLVLTVVTIILCTIHLSTGQLICGKLRRFRSELSETKESIKLTWSIHDACQSTVYYNITFGTIGGPLENQTFKWENESQITRVLKNLIPEKQYMILITVNFNKTTVQHSVYVIPAAGNDPSTKSNSNCGGIAGGVVAAFVFVVSVVIITLISVWLINRRRKQRSRNGMHYISVVHLTGNGSRKCQLLSCPGYLQIVHHAPCADYEVPRPTVMARPAITARPGITLLPNKTEYPRSEIHASADSNSSMDPVQMTTDHEPIQTASVGTGHVNSGQLISNGQMIKNKKLVKPYAVVDVKDVETGTSLAAAGQGILDRLRTKALIKSFSLCVDGSTAQVEQRSMGRYFTVPIYVNLNVPMTVNPSYGKSKV